MVEQTSGKNDIYGVRMDAWEPWSTGLLCLVSTALLYDVVEIEFRPWVRQHKSWDTSDLENLVPMSNGRRVDCATIMMRCLLGLKQTRKLPTNGEATFDIRACLQFDSASRRYQAPFEV